MKVLVSFFIIIFSYLAVAGSYSDSPNTVNFVDLVRYQGQWYEIVKLPNSFQEDCASNTTAEYSPADKGLIKVINSCVLKDGELQATEGRARVEDKETNAKLKVTFVKILGNWVFAFGGDYWVIELAEDYSTVVVGHPKRDFGWVLSRTPSLSRETLMNLAGRIEAQGYNPCDFISTKQSGGLQREVSLCDLVK